MSKKHPQTRQNPPSPAPGSGGPIPSVSPSAPQIPVQAGALSPQAAVTEKATIQKLARDLEQARGSRVIIHWLTERARISEAQIMPLYDILGSIGTVPKIDVVLFTIGGDTEVPWRIVSLIREFAAHFSVLIPYRAHSAGTLIAMGADEIVMTPLSVLGPIDPSRTHPLLPRREGSPEAEPISVQDMRHAMKFIREATEGTPPSPEGLAQIVTALFEKIHPLAIGAIEQSYALAKLIGTQCLGTHMNASTDEAAIKEIVDKLCDDYKSHSYQINRREAKKIGLKITDATPVVQNILMDMLKFYLSRPTAPKTPPAKGQKFMMPIGWLESTNMNLRCESNFLMGDSGQAKLIGDGWMTY